ncbi:hypothetical protein EKN06_13985 [Croceicoccus ponticola]|uniref:Uncharacterized protein n=1 Tax=Croceicoccus ponticola TaxID=2217664 RepID=A0A437GUM1_9SPHN|nr:hypothetical protein EKN06_13985 [Croceicoccus ponticola]
MIGSVAIGVGVAVGDGVGVGVGTCTGGSELPEEPPPQAARASVSIRILAFGIAWVMASASCAIRTQARVFGHDDQAMICR